MSLPISARKRLAFTALFASLGATALAQEGFAPVGGEYDIVGAIPGDQTRAQIAIGPNGGYTVWQDNAADGDGLGIAARRVDGTLSATLSSFRVNDRGVGDQENPQVAVTKEGGAVFVWQGGTNQFSSIFARLLSPNGTFSGPEIQVNTFANGLQTEPVLAVLNDGTIIVAWTSVGQDGSMAGIYAQRLSAQGAKLGGEFRVNVSTQLNQRNPSIASLAGGGFAISWISEKQKAVVYATDEKGVQTETTGGAVIYDVGVFASLYNAAGSVTRAEFRLDNAINICGSPVLAANANGGFLATWGEKAGPLSAAATASGPVGWDIYARAFSGNGDAAGTVARLNTYTYGDQIYPKIAALPAQHMVVWTSMGQDGSFEGIYKRLVDSATGAALGTEDRVNATTRGPQVYPSVSSDGANRFVAVWSSLVTVTEGYDLKAQRYAVTEFIPAPERPYASALSQSKVSVTWPLLAGYAGVKYELFVDSANDPISLEGNSFVAGQFAPGSTHSFKLGYLLADGRRSTLSEVVTVKTWGDDENFDGLPDDWQTHFWGVNRAKWAAANVDSDHDGATNIQEFLAGTNPLDAASVLSLRIASSVQGPRLEWNTQVGSIYQVQITTDFSNWSDASGLRLATGASDSIPATGEVGVSYYRVVRQR